MVLSKFLHYCVLARSFLVLFNICFIGSKQYTFYQTVLPNIKVRYKVHNQQIHSLLDLIKFQNLH